MSNSKSGKGVLFLCPTPIGNIKDITLRVLDCLHEVDFIAVEDTRQTKKLLFHYNIQKPLLIYHAHNQRKQEKVLLNHLMSGMSIALVTDAGMPGISDPGAKLVERAVEAGIDVVGLPGPSAAITALAISGLSTDRFVFYGFLSRKAKQRSKELEELSREQKTIIIYEAPHRLVETLKQLLNMAGEGRRAVIVRELTKKFEEVRRGTLLGHFEYFQLHMPKGEITIVMSGTEKDSRDASINDNKIRDVLMDLMREGLEPKKVVTAVSLLYELPKNKVYDIMLAIKKNKQGF